MDMTPSTEFIRHAAECARMAREAADKATKETWKSLAKRWLVCAALAEQESRTIRQPQHNARTLSRPSKRFAH
jgi:hypothetical protein